MWLPDRLRAVWKDVEVGRLSKEVMAAIQERELEVYRSEWRKALLQPDEQDLRTSLLREVARYYGMSDLVAVERLCAGAVATMRQEWEQQIDPSRRASIELSIKAPRWCTT